MRTVVETPTFSRQADKLFREDERRDLIDLLATRPEGVEIPGAGGVRKLRFGTSCRGKRGGGARAVYYYGSENMPVYALLAYAKSARTDPIPEERRRVAALAAKIGKTG